MYIERPSETQACSFPSPCEGGIVWIPKKILSSFRQADN